MPIPKPNKKEKKNDFISRCMGNDVMKKEYKDDKQRSAVCYSQWEKKNKSEGTIMNLRKKLEKGFSRKRREEVKLRIRRQQFMKMEVVEGKPLEDFEYLIHHIETKDGIEEIHHCYLYDHIANLFKQAHLVIKNGKVTLDGKTVKDGTFHVIVGFEPTQEIVWSDEEAKEAKIKPKAMKAGMTLKEKAKEW